MTNSPVEAKDAFSSPSGKKGWRVYDLESGTISFSRDVVFCEEEFPFSSSRSIDSTHQSVDALPIGFTPDIDDDWLLPHLSDTSVAVPTVTPHIPISSFPRT